MRTPGAYPEEWESDLVLADGRTAHFRPITPEDADGIDALYSRLSKETIYYRFFAPLPRLAPEMLTRFVTVDYVDRMAFIALEGDDIIAVARYDRIPGTAEAEVAFLVDDVHQGRGIGGLMLEQLAAIAALNGITDFIAETLPDNRRMLTVFEQAGYRTTERYQEGVVEVHFPITPTTESVRRTREREEHATSQSISALVTPSSVALVGASRIPGSVGDVLLANILSGAFSGSVYPVNRNATSVRGVPAYPSIAAIGKPVDLAIIAVAAEETFAALADAARAKVKICVVITAGFSDVGDDERERALITYARANGMRIVGPNSLGVIVAHPDYSLQAGLAPFSPLAGGASVHAQSGPLSLAILGELTRQGLGINAFISSGNKADISSNDLLVYWRDDPATQAVLLYIENFGNPRTFSRIARETSRVKPIIAVKTRFEQRVPSQPHFADDRVRALFRHTGVLRVDTINEMVETAAALVAQPLPDTNTFAVLANSGGPAPLCVDAALASGLSLAKLSGETREAISNISKSSFGTANPVELGPQVTPEEWGEILSLLCQDQAVSAVLVHYIPTVVGTREVPTVLAPPDSDGRLRGLPESHLDRAAQVAHALSEVSARFEKPVLANFLSLPGVADALHATDGSTVPSYRFPEGPARALAKMWEYALWKRQPLGAPLECVDTEEIRKIIQGEGPSTGSIFDLDDQVTRGILEKLGLQWERPIDTPLTMEVNLTIENDRRLGAYLRLSLNDPVSRALGASATSVLPDTDEDVRRAISDMPGVSLLDEAGGVSMRDHLTHVVGLLSGLCLHVPEIANLKCSPLLITQTHAFAPQISVIADTRAPSSQMLTHTLRDLPRGSTSRASAPPSPREPDPQV